MRILLLCLMLCSYGCKDFMPVPVTPDRKPIPVNPPLDLTTKPQQAPAATPEVTPEVTKQVAPQDTQQVKPPEAPVLRNTLIQYTIDNCRWCEYDRNQVFPSWKAKGWNIPEPVKHKGAQASGVYPRYEIYDADGNKKTHKGSLISYKP